MPNALAARAAIGKQMMLSHFFLLFAPATALAAIGIAVGSNACLKAGIRVLDISQISAVLHTFAAMFAKLEFVEQWAAHPRGAATECAWCLGILVVAGPIDLVIDYDNEVRPRVEALVAMMLGVPCAVVFGVLMVAVRLFAPFTVNG